MSLSSFTVDRRAMSYTSVTARRCQHKYIITQVAPLYVLTPPFVNIVLYINPMSIFIVCLKKERTLKKLVYKCLESGIFFFFFKWCNMFLFWLEFVFSMPKFRGFNSIKVLGLYVWKSLTRSKVRLGKSGILCWPKQTF